MHPEIVRKITVTERFSVSISRAVRRAAGVEAGDTVRWRVDDDSYLNAVDIGEPTNAADDHDPGSRDA